MYKVIKCLYETMGFVYEGKHPKSPWPSGKSKDYEYMGQFAKRDVRPFRHHVVHIWCDCRAKSLCNAIYGHNPKNPDKARNVVACDRKDLHAVFP